MPLKILGHESRMQNVVLLRNKLILQMPIHVILLICGSDSGVANVSTYVHRIRDLFLRNTGIQICAYMHTFVGFQTRFDRP